MKILIVEDEKVSSTKMQVIMNTFGECDAVASGTEALAAFKQGWEIRAPYDLITLDIGLPDINGMDLLLSMREYEEQIAVPLSKKTKIIMVTAQNDKDYVITCLSAKCSGYIIKPFTKETITKCLRSVYLDYVNSVLTAVE